MRNGIISAIAIATMVLVAFLGLGQADSNVTSMISIIFLSAISPTIAALCWPPRLILMPLIFLLVPILFAIHSRALWDPSLWPTVGPVLGILLFVDFLAVLAAWQREKGTRGREERDALLTIGSTLGLQRPLPEVADAFDRVSQRILGAGQVQLWVLSPGHQELRLVPSRDAALHSRVRGGNVSLEEVRVPLDAAEACAQAIRVGHLIDFADPRDGLPATWWNRWGDAVGAMRLGSSEDETVRRSRSRGIVLAKPLIWNGQTMGALTFRPTNDSRRPVDQLALESLTTMCASAVDSSIHPPSVYSSTTI